MKQEIRKCSKYVGVRPSDVGDMKFNENDVMSQLGSSQSGGTQSAGTQSAVIQSESRLVSATFVFSASQVNIPVSFSNLSSTSTDTIAISHVIDSTEDWLAANSKLVSESLHKKSLAIFVYVLGNDSFSLSWNDTFDSNKTNNSTNSRSLFLGLTISASLVGMLIICIALAATRVAIRRHGDHLTHTESGETNDNMLGKIY